MMKSRRVVAAMIAYCVLLPGYAEGQQTRNDVSVGVLLLWGGLSGAGLAAAYINPTGEGWLVSDEAALPLGAILGVGTALMVRATAVGSDKSEGRRPRLRTSAGTGGRFDWDYSLAYRAPVGGRFELEAAVLIVAHSWQRIERQTRCGGWFGCSTGNYVTDERHQESVSAVVRGIYHIGTGSPWHPTMSVGGGPTAVHVETFNEGTTQRTGLALDGALGVERGRRYRWTAEAGLRVTPLGSVSRAAIDDGSWYIRMGFALGG